MKRLFALFAVTAFLIGCSSTKLEPGGAYAPVDVAGAYAIQPDLQFYQVDAAYKVAYTTVDTLFQFEKANREMLWRLSPNIKKTLDQIRPDAWKANVAYHEARKVYMANPVPTNLTQLQGILQKMQQISASAQAGMQSAKLIP